MSRLAQTRPGAISAGLLLVTAGCGVGSFFWEPLRWIDAHANELSTSDGVAVAMGIAAVAAIGAGFAGVVVAFAISSERPAVIEFRNIVGPLLKANWSSVIRCAFAAAILALTAGTLFAAKVYGWAAWISIAAVALLLHSMARNLYLFSVLLEVIAIGDERDKRVNNVVPVDKVITAVG